MPEVEDIASVPRLGTEDRERLAEKIHDKFEKVFAGEDISDAEDTVKEEPVEAAVSEEATPVQDEPKSEEVEVVAKEEAAGDKDAPILPDAYRRSLKNYEWTDDEINAALSKGGDGFVATAAKIHATRNRETQALAAQGRAARQAPPQSAQLAPEQQTGLKPIDAAELKKVYGDEALIDKIVGPVNSAIDQINRLMPVARQSQERARRAEIDSLGKQVDGFFGDPGMKVYAETYGTGTGTLTEPQLAERNKVLELADAIVGGATLQRRSIKLEEALQLALDSVTSGTKEKTARDSIAQTLKAREKGISLKPGARTQATPVRKPGDSPSRSELEKNVRSKLKAVFASA